MNNQQAVPQNKMNVTTQDQRSSLSGLVSGITHIWNAIMNIMQAAVSSGGNGTIPCVAEEETLDDGEVMPDYALSLVIYPSESSLSSTRIVNYEEKLISVDQLPIYNASDGLRINRVYGYMNMVLCSVTMGQEYRDAKATNDQHLATAYIQSIVDKLFPHEDPSLAFMWSVVPWNELGHPIPENEAAREILDGASGGGMM